MLSRSFLILLLLFIAVAGAVPAGADQPSVIVEEARVNPPVLMPGDQGLISITLTNTASTATKTESSVPGTGPGTSISRSTEINPVIEQVVLDGKGDIRVLGGISTYRGELGPRQSVTLTFLVEAPTYTGVFFPVLSVRIRDAEGLKFPIPVNVNTPIAGLRQPALVLKQSTIGPFAPGERVTLPVSLLNAGSADAADILVRVGGNSTGLFPVGARSVDLPRLPRGGNHSFVIDLQVDRTAGTGLREVPVEIVYTTTDGTRVQGLDTLGVDLRGRGELAVASLKTDPVRVRQGDAFDLVVRMDNTGTGDARSASARVDLPLQGAKEAFVGTVRPGSNAPAVFTLEADRAGEFEYTFNATFEDDWGTHSTVRVLHLSVVPSGDALLAVALVALVVVGGLLALALWWRRRRAGHA
ncbi:MAG: COG1361 S-layer family protein [Methanoregulaceae archaeon]